MHDVQIRDIQAALALTDFNALAAQRAMAPEPRALHRSSGLNGSPRQASVLLLVFPQPVRSLSLVLIRRTEHEHDVHSGQISLPGGSQEPGEEPIKTALREAHEELGVAPSSIRILGHLSPLYIPPSDFEVHPFVGSLAHYPQWTPQTSEVAEVLEVPLMWLFDPSRKKVEDWTFANDTLHVPWYDIVGHKVWGATAIILSEFEQRLQLVLDGVSR